MKRALLGVALALAGCASLRNTPAQDLAWGAWQSCPVPPNVRLDRIDPNGQIWFMWVSSNAGVSELQACLLRFYAERGVQRAAAVAAPRAVTPEREHGESPAGGAATKPASPPASTSRPSTLRAPVAVPVQIVEGIVLVPATLNGALGVTLILDTGSQRTLLTPAVARKLGLGPMAGGRRGKLSVLGGRQLDVPLVSLARLEVGGAAAEDLEIGVLDVLPTAPNVDGLLGTDFLERYTITLDRGARQLRLAPSK